MERHEDLRILSTELHSVLGMADELGVPGELDVQLPSGTATVPNRETVHGIFAREIWVGMPS
ncbi:hypothetical protein [Streptomyces beijiangensis]|uniref:Uncharacterized protein n=1 Tax=Streptomyces beijiangensis TaxID=163361 RepID=A0A939F6F7_9ACTN|nr:hypothetical protein [Streptomyces beijiangensis]MBO0512788.1 hypothetical protein [Streptomyces beijiangensis]